MTGEIVSTTPPPGAIAKVSQRVVLAYDKAHDVQEDFKVVIVPLVAKVIEACLTAMDKQAERGFYYVDPIKVKFGRRLPHYWQRHIVDSTIYALLKAKGLEQVRVHTMTDKLMGTKTSVAFGWENVK